jgi:hypothetical protein
MTKSTKAATKQALGRRSDILQLFGDIDDQTVVEVLKLEPTIDELEQANAWIEGLGNRLAHAGHPQTERIGKLIDLLNVDEDEEPPYLR